MPIPPLSGKRIVVTRPPHQAEELADPLRQLGADVVLLPVISIVAPENPAAIQEAAARIDTYDWIIFTSANGVAAFAATVISRVPRPRIAAVGLATREAVEELGWRVDVVPDKYVAEELVKALPLESIAGQRVLIPSAAVTREIVPRALEQLGAVVDVVEAYRTVLTPGIAERAREVFDIGLLPHWVTFASSSAVDKLAELVAVERLKQVRLVSIGPVTSASIRKHGLTVDREASEHTIRGIVNAILGGASDEHVYAS